MGVVWEEVELPMVVSLASSRLMLMVSGFLILKLTSPVDDIKFFSSSQDNNRLPSGPTPPPPPPLLPLLLRIDAHMGPFLDNGPRHDMFAMTPRGTRTGDSDGFWE